MRINIEGIANDMPATGMYVAELKELVIAVIMVEDLKRWVGSGSKAGPVNR